ncbi:MAG: hypothetical protein JSS27_19025 [Planctomycetes bacterium]|nr:hypothetical protein [Planctomycetota bacterium]
MKRFALTLSLAVFALGCGQSGGGPTIDAIQFGDKKSGSEVFDGMMELFGQTLRVERHVEVDAAGNYIKHGPAVAYYENGQKAGEMSFQHDKPHGKTLAWFESGKKKLQGQSTEGLATGVWSEWYENSQKQTEGEYIEGERHGHWSFWEPSGQLIEVVEYRGGKKIGVVEKPTLGVKR